MNALPSLAASSPLEWHSGQTETESVRERVRLMGRGWGTAVAKVEINSWKF